MDKEQQREEISRKICEHCDNFDGRACTVNYTGECALAKESAESILAIGYDRIEEPRPIEQATDLPAKLIINGVVYVRKGE